MPRTTPPKNSTMRNGGIFWGSRLPPLAGLEKQREQYAHAVEALSDPERTRLVLVARLQKSTLQEVARTHDELSAIGLKNQYVVINGERAVRRLRRTGRDFRSRGAGVAGARGLYRGT